MDHHWTVAGHQWVSWDRHVMITDQLQWSLITGPKKQNIWLSVIFSFIYLINNVKTQEEL